jgi:hypothetical protein
LPSGFLAIASESFCLFSLLARFAGFENPCLFFYL